MLRIDVVLTPEGWDEEKQMFVEPKIQTLQLEHSLVSLSKWEAKWCKAFFSNKEKTTEETVDYIKCMTLTQNVKSETYDRLSQENINDIVKYIEAPMTATTIPEHGKTTNKQEVMTNEVFYYYMFKLQIPKECEKWHLNRLMTLIRVFDAKETPPKKMSRRETIEYYADINEKRRKQLNSKG